ncbi:MAG: cation:proton antiporter [Armatimonadetes bacterium]|nr:cation:proton antiporter [Armatimonadota bacterium]
MNLILALSLLLALGFGAAQLARLVHLPSITGYILAGIALGPVGLDLIPHELLGTQLRGFTAIALMLVAFSIGERFDLDQLASSARILARVSFGETIGTFVLVGLGVGLSVWALGLGEAFAGPAFALAVGLVAASIAVATAPASMVAVIRELGAAGPISRALLSSVVVNNALSITLFGLTAAAAKALLGTAPGHGIWHVLLPFINTIASLALGLGVGLLIDMIVHRLSRRHDVLIVSLAAVFFVGGFAEFIGLSSLLAGVAAGFAVVNRDRRDVRAFRAINDFEPPLYGIFFALAGVELHLSDMLAAGLVGVIFIVGRTAGKCFGAWLGARRGGLDPAQAKLLGLGLLPQAGLAIGLAFLVRSDEALLPIRSLIVSLTVASVVVNELIGPPLVRLVLQRVGEAAAPAAPEATAPAATGEKTALIVPWTWPKLNVPEQADGHVVVALNNPATAAGLTRVGALLAHYYRARLMALYVVPAGELADGFWYEEYHDPATELFAIAHHETERLGYPLETETEFAAEPAEGVIRIADELQVQTLVMGHPQSRGGPLFGRIVDSVAREVECPVVVLKQAGALHTERILVPVAIPDDFCALRPLVCTLAMIMEHQITVLRLMPSETDEAGLQASVQDLRGWPTCQGLPGTVTYRAVGSENRVHDILAAAAEHDIVLMTTDARAGLRRLFFGSLAADVAARLRKPIIMLRSSAESQPLREQD